MLKSFIQNRKKLKYLKQRAKDSDVEALYELGLCYETGKLGTSINIPKAVSFYFKAAELEHEKSHDKLLNFDLISKAKPDYMRYIAYYYFRFHDKEAEQKLYEIAAKGGDGIAMHNVGYSLEKSDPKKAFKWYKKSARTGEPNGIYAVAKCYEEGLGTEINLKKAFRLLKKIEKHNIAEALTDLGTYYGKGVVTKKDTKKALELYIRARDLGDLLAHTNIAWHYENGIEVEKDMDKAISIYKYAAQSGEKHAIEELNRLGICISDWFVTVSERDEAIRKAKLFLEKVGMCSEGIEKFLSNDETVWHASNHDDTILSWNEKHPDSTLDTIKGVCDLYLVLIWD